MTVFSARDGVATTPARVVVDSRGFVWFPSCEGLARFDGNGFRIFTPADGLPGPCTFDIIERADGNYWIAAREQLCLFKPAAGGTRFECESPKLGAINTLVEAQEHLWCGTDAGLWRRPAHGGVPWEAVRLISSGAGQHSVAVRRLLRDTRGDVWAALSRLRRCCPRRFRP